MRPIKTASEQDTYTRWRHVLAYLDRPGVIKRIKRATHKRERQEAKQEIKEQHDQ